MGHRSCVSWFLRFLVVLGLGAGIATSALGETCEDEKLRVEEANPGTTVVCEERVGGSNSDNPFGPTTRNPGDGTETRTSGGHGGGGGRQAGPKFSIQPRSFIFKKCPGNSQKAYCNTIRFLAGYPPVFVDIGVEVEAPYEMRDGKIHSATESQIDSAAAAMETATYFYGLLQTNQVNLTQVNAGFSGHMDAIMRSHGIGYRVKACPPVEKPKPPC